MGLWGSVRIFVGLRDCGTVGLWDCGTVDCRVVSMGSTVLAEMREKLKQLEAPQTTEKEWVDLRFATLFADSGNDMERIDELRDQARSDASTLYAHMATLAESLSGQIKSLTEALLLSEDFLNGKVSSALSAVSTCQPVEGAAAPSSKRQKS